MNIHKASIISSLNYRFRKLIGFDVPKDDQNSPKKKIKKFRQGLDNSDDFNFLEGKIQFHQIKACKKLFILKAQSELWAFGSSYEINLPIYLPGMIKKVTKILDWKEPILEFSFSQDRLMFINQNNFMYGWGNNLHFQISHESIETFESPKLNTLKLLSSIQGELSPERDNLLQLETQTSRSVSNRYSRDKRIPISTSNLSHLSKVKRGPKSQVFSSVETVSYGTYYFHKGGVYSQGDCTSGLLGRSRTTKVSSSPMRIYLPIPNQNSVVGISCSGHHCIAWDSVGRCYSWGRNINYTLGQSKGGLKENELQPEPRLVTLMDGVKIINCKATDTCSLALTCRGRVYYWGM